MRHAILFAAISLAALGFGSPVRTAAQTAAASGPADYATFTKGLTPQRGLFTIWRKSGKVYIELSKDQLDTDFIQTAVPKNGLGGFVLTPGLPYLEFPSARIVRFTRADDKIVVTWPNTSFIATPNTPAARAVAESFAPSVIATAAIAAEDAASGNVVVDASYLLGDVLDLTDAFRFAFNTDKTPGSAYRLDDTRSYFGPTKSFPENVIVEADQTFVSAMPPNVFDNVIDARAIQVDVKYNIAKAPALGSYTPRLADDRVGYYPNIQLQFDSDNVHERNRREIVRWNLARHPMVYYISNTVPVQYRDTIRGALLEWNKAFAAIGYPNAVVVKDQPDDPNWDPDDIRYNTVHWLTLAYGGGYAQAGLVWDPRTGEMIHTSIVVDADLMRFGYEEGVNFVNPVRAADAGPAFATREAAYAAGAKESALFGLSALWAMDDIAPGQLPPHYALDFLKSIVLHESGHNWGLQHNFIASEAYTSAQVRSRTFTQEHGLANSVMEYTPTNVWPKGMSSGNYFQTVLGPYDYYAIRYGYAPIAGATTPEQERPTLRRWASQWSNPWYRFAMDEDVSWASGHAIDPRIDQFDLTNDNLSWCDAQLRISNTIVRTMPARFERTGGSHDDLREAFEFALFPTIRCTRVAWHYIGGEALSRAHVGDSGAAPPLTPISRSESKRAFAFLETHLFSPSAWNLQPALLRQLVYSEWVTDLPQPLWAYSPPLRHDEPISTIVEQLQQQTLASIFNPVLLQRLDDLSLKYHAGSTMSLSDDFAWTQYAVFGDLRTPAVTSMGEVHRSLQQFYARMLAQMLLAPQPGTPYDAQSLARAQLIALRDDARAARHRSGLDPLTTAHVAALESVADQALTARMAIPPPMPADSTP
ncbi:MAG TPA: zinc-dependent metalloprotease [Candidatus Cybelea sp.]